MAYGTKNFDNFVPELWSARLLQNLDKTFVYPQCANRTYEGEVRNLGDTVHIQKFGDIEVKDYTRADGVGEPKDPGAGSTVALTIDQAKYFNFKVEDIEAVQANVNLMEKAMQRAAYAIGDVIDQYIAAFVNQAGIDGGEVAVTPQNAYDTLVNLKVALNKENVPTAGRFVVVPPEFIGMLEKDDRYTKYDEADVKANGVKGRVAGFDVRESNNVPFVSDGSKYKVMAGTDMAIGFAGQIAKMEAFRPEASFSDACKGLYVYGAKVVEPKALAKLVCTF